MTIESKTKHRRSIRLPQYDYTSPGAYFITICTHGRACTLTDPLLVHIVEKVWCWTTKATAEDAGVDYVVMPNHVHGIVWIQEANAVGAQHPAHSLPPKPTPLSKKHGRTSVDAGAAPLRPDVAPRPAVEAQHPASSLPPTRTPLSKAEGSSTLDAGAAPLRADRGSHLAVRKGSLAAIIRTFKSVSTQRINAVRGSPGATVWQRNYYEHIVRSEAELRRIREYISNNPRKWELDRENPNRLPNVAYEREWDWLEGTKNRHDH